MNARFRMWLSCSLMVLVPMSRSFAQTGWTIQDSGTANDLYAVSFVDAATGTVVGDAGTILHTTDDGRTCVVDLPGRRERVAARSLVRERPHRNRRGRSHPAHHRGRRLALTGAR